MPEPIIIPWHIQRAFIQAHREYTFLYSTNAFFMSQYGQAWHCFGESNAFGIPVRWRFCKSDNSSYFSDDTFQALTKNIIDKAFANVPRDKPIIALHGIGKGASDLIRRAPQTYTYIHNMIDAIQYPNIQWNYRC